MNIDPFFFTFGLPGFVFVWSFRKFFGFDKDLNAWAWTCWSVLFGIVNVYLWQWSLKEHIELIPQILNNPIAASISLSLFAIMFWAIIAISFKLIQIGLKKIVELIP